MVVLPGALTTEECELLVVDTERILASKPAAGSSSARVAERWAYFSEFSPQCQALLDALAARYTARRGRVFSPDNFLAFPGTVRARARGSRV